MVQRIGGSYTTKKNLFLKNGLFALLK